MTGKLKKAIASLMAVASLSTCAVGISASAINSSGNIMRDAGSPGSAGNTSCSWNYTTTKSTSTLSVSGMSVTSGSTYLKSSISCGNSYASNNIYTYTNPKTVTLYNLVSGKAAYANSYVVNVTGTIRATVSING